MDYEVVVVGAGVVGLACAAALAARGRRVLVLERHAQIGMETSSRNSEVIHAGIYYPQGSLKATLCVEGNQRLYALCREFDLPHNQCGKLIVATSEAELAALAEIHARAAANGVPLTRKTAAETAAMEPHVVAVGALWSPTTGIIDSHALMRLFRQQAVSDGADLALCTTLTGAEVMAGGYRLAVTDADGERVMIETAAVVNAAGLDADRVAATVGLDVVAADYQLHYCRGVYFRLAAKHRGRIRHLIYPVPTPHTVGLGIHVTLDLAGDIRLGPDVEYLSEHRQDYTVDESRRAAFFTAVSHYVRGIDEADLTPDQAGIRPKLQGPGQPVRDFVIAEESARGFPGWVNLIGIESPGLTCSPVIAARVATLLDN
jgi:L-2-hydroxyglutarate oxidase LhgO